MEKRRFFPTLVQTKGCNCHVTPKCRISLLVFYEPGCVAVSSGDITFTLKIYKLSVFVGSSILAAASGRLSVRTRLGEKFTQPR